MPGHALPNDIPRDRRIALSDERAWNAIAGWPRAARFDAVRGGLDYGELTRSFLWDKVGRAIRVQLDPSRSAFELAQLAEDAPVRPTRLPRFVQRAANRASLALGTLRVRGRSNVYVPVASPLLRRTVAALAEQGVRIVAPRKADPAYRSTIRAPRPPFDPPADREWATALVDAIERGLAAFDVTLLDGDVARLHAQIALQTSRIQSLAARIEAVSPEALLLFADNHPPFQEYTFLARSAGVPVVMLQHGLDCEWQHLDRLYAPHAALWGEARRSRYAPFAGEAELRVTGNPELDDRRLPEAISPPGEEWLWLTRPHAPERCYAPSRWPDEGVSILDALLDALARHRNATLAVKPHPADAVAPYAARIAASPVRDRVRITMQPLDALAARATLVFSEDSTAALEALFHGRVLVHTHFAPAPPVLPLAASGAALLARDGAELLDAIDVVRAASARCRNAMLAAQRAFILEHAGPCDGGAAARVAAFVREVVGRRKR